jgi:hypothetical protein
MDGIKASDSTTNLFDFANVDALGVGGNWHQITPGSFALSRDEEDQWWISAELVPNLKVGDTPTHTVWFPYYEVNGYRVLDASAD